MLDPTAIETVFFLKRTAGGHITSRVEVDSAEFCAAVARIGMPARIPHTAFARHISEPTTLWVEDDIEIIWKDSKGKERKRESTTIKR